MREKSLDPADRMGVYKRLADVPDRYRLANYGDEYRGRDVWQEFCEAFEYQQGDHDDYRQEVDRVGRRWKAFMDDRDRHHALATPEDVEAWCVHLLEEREFTPRHALTHWVRVKRLYDWLQWHTGHPHVYHPALMAAAAGGAAGEIWDVKAERNRDRRENYRKHHTTEGES